MFQIAKCANDALAAAVAGLEAALGRYEEIDPLDLDARANAIASHRVAEVAAPNAEALLFTVNAAIGAVRGVVKKTVADGNAAVHAADAACRAGAADSDAKAEAARVSVRLADDMTSKFATVAALASAARGDLALLLARFEALRAA